MYKKILIGFDGSECALKAFKVALNMAASLKTELFVIAVVPSIIYTAYTPDIPIAGLESFTNGLENEYKKSIQKLKEEAGNQNIMLNSYIVEGHPVDKIVEYSEQIKADLIIIGSRGLSGIERLFLGSISDGVAHHSKIDVLIVKK